MRLTKKEIEEHLEPFQTAPSFLRFIYEGAGEYDADSQYRQILDTVELVRYNPHLDSEGEIISVDFWIYWMPAYFDAARTHVFQCSSITAPDSYERRFIDKRGVSYIWS